MNPFRRLLMLLTVSLMMMVCVASPSAAQEPTAFFKGIAPLVVDSPAYHDILADGLGGGDQGVNERCPSFL